MHAPLLFFDSTPSGRVLNRLSKDVDSLDNMIPFQLKLVLVALADLAAIVIVVSVSTPFFLLLALPIAAAFVAIQRFYVPTSRQLRRLEANARSPLISHFSESIQGILEQYWLRIRSLLLIFYFVPSLLFLNTRTCFSILNCTF